MNDMTIKTEEVATQLLTWLQQFGGEAEGFAREQVPLFVEEYIRYHQIANCTTFVFGIVCLIGCILATKYLLLPSIKKIDEVSIDEEDQYVVASIATGAAVLVFFILGLVSLTSFYDATKSIVAPRVYIVDNLLKK